MPGSPPTPLGRHPVVESFAAANAALAKNNRLHPLHSVEMVASYTRNTGEYFDRERCTGRTTILALKYLQEALANPHKVVHVEDHHPTMWAHTELTKQIGVMAEKLGLQHIRVNPALRTIKFTTD